DWPAGRMMAATLLVLGLGSWVFVIRATIIVGYTQRPKTKDQSPKATKLTTGCCQFLKCAQRIRSGHLFTPVHDEIGVVEWASFDISSFRRGLNVLVIEWLPDQ